MERQIALQFQHLSLRQLFFVLREFLLELQYRCDSGNQLELSSRPDILDSDSSEDSGL